MGITQLIRDGYVEQGRLLAALEEIDRTDTEALGAVWGRLKALLDPHAGAVERFFYPDLLKLGTGAADDTEEETEDAIADHNEIRQTGEAVEQRHRLAVRFLAFQCAHLTGVPATDKDVDASIADPKQAVRDA